VGQIWPTDLLPYSWGMSSDACEWNYSITGAPETDFKPTVSAVSGPGRW